MSDKVGFTTKKGLVIILQCIYVKQGLNNVHVFITVSHLVIVSQHLFTWFLQGPILLACSEWLKVSAWSGLIALHD